MCPYVSSRLECGTACSIAKPNRSCTRATKARVFGKPPRSADTLDTFTLRTTTSSRTGAKLSSVHGYRVPINNPLPEPDAPHDGVSKWTCVCGASYDSSAYGITFQQGVDLVRANNDPQVHGGGYRSRRPVLWAMHVLKLAAWYQEHSACQSGEPY